MNNEFKNAPEGTTHKLDGKWYDIDSDVALEVGAALWVRVFTIGSYWADVILPAEEYVQLKPREQNLWYDFEEQEAFAFPTKADKFLYNGEKACIIGVSADGIFPVLDCAEGVRKLTADDLEFITPIETPKVEKRLEHTLKGQLKTVEKLLKAYDENVKIDKAKLVELYEEGWRVSKNDSKD